MYYKLDGKTPVPCSREYFEKDFRKSDRRVAFTDNKDKSIEVSTVFLGLDHAYNGAKELFETMVFENGEKTYMNRYSTWDAAETGHKEAVARYLSD